MKTTELILDKNPSVGLKDKLVKDAIIKLLQQISYGNIFIIDPLGNVQCGDIQSTLTANLIIHDLQFYTLVSLKGSIGFAEAFMHGYIETNNLTTLLLILAKNLGIVEKSESNFASLLFKLFNSTLYIFNRNTIYNAKQRIMAHYDLSNDMFKLFLGQDMSYSSLVFRNINDSLEEAAEHKNTRLLEYLQIDSGDKILEIGTGWGALAITAANKYACEVTTTTISNNQYEYVNTKIKELNLSDRINLLNMDYRQLNGKYNKLISVEMIEAVGYEYLGEYFKACSNLLESDGLFALQCIIIKDNQFERAKKEVDFIKKYIFPGGCLPSMQSIVTTVAKYTDFSMLVCEDITYDYAITLRKWREKFLGNQQQLFALGFDVYFIKMWEYYFSYCEAGFLNRNIMCMQIVFAKPGYRDPRQNAKNC